MTALVPCRAILTFEHGDLGEPLQNSVTVDDRGVYMRTSYYHDAIAAYLQGDGVLFSNDGFGMHLACSERFADQVEETLWKREASKYYANILLHFSPLVKRLLAQLPSLDGLQVVLQRLQHALGKEFAGVLVTIGAPLHGPRSVLHQ